MRVHKKRDVYIKGQRLQISSVTFSDRNFDILIEAGLVNMRKEPTVLFEDLINTTRMRIKRMKNRVTKTVSLHFSPLRF